MFYFDLLYPNEHLRVEGRKNSRIDENLIHNLQLSELIHEDIMDKREYGMLCNEIKYLPVEKEVILHRQAVLEDFRRNPCFMENIISLCESLQEKVAERKYNIWEPPIPIYKNLIEHIKVLQHNYQVLSSAKLKIENKLNAEVLREITQFIQDDQCKNKLKDIIEQLTAVLKSSAVEYKVDYTYGQSVYKVRIQQLHQDMVYPFTEKKGLRKKQLLDTELFIEGSDDYIMGNNLNEIYSKTLVHLCDFAMKLNRKIVKPFKMMGKEISYYKVGIRLQDIYAKLQINSCLPQISDMKEGRLQFSNLYSLYLLMKYYKEEKTEDIINIQSNCYSNDHGRVAIITGVNSGGKTIFLQSIGMAQILMQLGFYVPAASYHSSIASYIASLFAKEEDQNTIHGKLEKELVSIHELSRNIKQNSLILMNEILATTSEEEGSRIMADVIRAFSITKSNILFVTHFRQLADMVENQSMILEEGERAVNYTTESIHVEGGRVKTYHIVPGKPQKDIWEQELIDIYIRRR